MGRSIMKNKSGKNKQTMLTEPLSCKSIMHPKFDHRVSFSKTIQISSHTQSIFPLTLNIHILLRFMGDSRKMDTFSGKCQTGPMIYKMRQKRQMYQFLNFSSRQFQILLYKASKEQTCLWDKIDLDLNFELSHINCLTLSRCPEFLYFQLGNE